MAHFDPFRSNVPATCQLLTMVEDNPNLLQGFQRASKAALDRGLVTQDDHFIRQLLTATRERPDLVKIRTPLCETCAATIRCTNAPLRPKIVPIDLHRKKY